MENHNNADGLAELARNAIEAEGDVDGDDTVALAHAYLALRSAPSPDVQLVKLLRELVAGEDDCSYDHHGYCQSHRLDPKPCPVERANALLAHIQRED